jgi:hypothetical protein
MKIIENKVITFIWRVAESEQKAVPQIRTLRDRSSHTGTPGQKRTATSGAPTQRQKRRRRMRISMPAAPTSRALPGSGTW